MLLCLIKIDEEALSCLNSDDLDENILITAAKESIAMKVKICSAFLRMLQKIRDENNSILNMKGLCPGSKIPKDVFSANELKNAYEKFSITKDKDSVNEIRPDLTEEEIEKCISSSLFTNIISFNKKPDEPDVENK